MQGISILLLMPEISWGGAERQFRYLIENANAHDADIVLLNMHLHDCQNTDAERAFAERNHATYHEIKPERKVETLFDRIKYSLYVNRTIKGVLRRQKINAAIVYEPQGCYSIPFLKRNKVKVIYSERNTGDGVVHSHFLKMLVEQADVITCNSLFAKKILEEGLGHSVIQINNGIQMSGIDGVKKKSDSDRTVILVPARIAPIKNQLLVVEMLHGMEDSENYKVIFAGKIEDEEYASVIKKKIHEYNLEKVCYMPGFVKDMQGMYSEADVVILPSFEEGMSNVILECYVNRKLILCSRIPMNIVNSEAERFAFNPNDPADLRENLKKALGMSQKELEEYTDSNFDFVYREYSIDNMVKSYVRIAR